MKDDSQELNFLVVFVTIKVDGGAQLCVLRNLIFKRSLPKKK